jgi:PX domain
MLLWLMFVSPPCPHVCSHFFLLLLPSSLFPSLTPCRPAAYAYLPTRSSHSRACPTSPAHDTVCDAASVTLFPLAICCPGCCTAGMSGARLHCHFAAPAAACAADVMCCYYFCHDLGSIFGDTMRCCCCCCCCSLLPARPEKNAVEGRRMSDGFVEERRAALQRYLNRLAAHPAAAHSEACTALWAPARLSGAG